MNYIERFKIPGVPGLLISKEENGMFKAWSGGCGVGGDFKTIEKCREFLFEDAIQDLIRKEDEASKTYALCVKSKTILGNDVFNLGQFKIPV